MNDIPLDSFFGDDEEDAVGGIDFSRMMQEAARKPRPIQPMPQPKILPNGGRPNAGPRRRFDGRTMPWGKWQGTPLEQVPVQYVGWMFSEQLAGEMLLPDDLAAALLAAFLKQLRKMPVYARELDALGRIPRAVDDGRRAPTVTGDEEV